jgi:hypothetical protein
MFPLPAEVVEQIAAVAEEEEAAKVERHRPLMPADVSARIIADAAAAEAAKAQRRAERAKLYATFPPPPAPMPADVSARIIADAAAQDAKRKATHE